MNFFIAFLTAAFEECTIQSVFLYSWEGACNWVVSPRFNVIYSLLESQMEDE